MKVRCKSAWLLHFAAALPFVWPWQLDNSTVQAIDLKLPASSWISAAAIAGRAIVFGLGKRPV
jgi:hypothetical protein